MPTGAACLARVHAARRSGVQTRRSSRQTDDAALLARLRDGDESAFDDAVTRFYPAMLAVARGYVRERAVAEEVVQEAWLGVLRGLSRFEGRSTLRTWILQIVANIARDRAVREARSLPFSSLASDADGPALDAERFQGP